MINHFGKKGGFDVILSRISSSIPISLSYFKLLIKTLNNVSILNNKLNKFNIFRLNLS